MCGYFSGPRSGARCRADRSASTDGRGWSCGAQFLHRIGVDTYIDMNRRLLIAALLALFGSGIACSKSDSPTRPRRRRQRRAHFLHGHRRKRRHRVWQFVAVRAVHRLSGRHRLRSDPAAPICATTGPHGRPSQSQPPRRGAEQGDRGSGARHRPADQRAGRQLHRAAGAVRADQHHARHDLRRRQRRQRDRPRRARGTRRQRSNGYIDAQVRQWGTDLEDLVARIRSRAPNARIVALNMINLAGAPYVASRPHVGEEHHAAHRGRHFRSRQRAHEPQGAGRRSDVRCAAVSAVELLVRRLPSRRRRLRRLRRRRAAGAAETARTTSRITNCAQRRLFQ